MNPLLEIKNLHVHFPIVRGPVFRRRKLTLKALNGVSLQLNKGKTLGLVGESGCGKSTLGRAITRLYDPVAGEVRLDGVDIAKLSQRQLRSIRPKLQMIFQDPYTSLNPRLTVYETVAEPIITNFRRLGRAKLQTMVLDAMDKVCLARKFIKRYPHEFSGGQRQRIAIARALALRPQVIICDEPVSALDISIQSQILNLLVELQRQFNLSYIFISHDLSAVKHISHEIAVMYLGKIVETTQVKQLFEAPSHPYTQALMNAIPQPDPKKERERQRVLITGDIPDAADLPRGCSFNTRCKQVMDKCYTEVPELREVGDDHRSACHLS
ncbi:MAG: ATP-binding cassette domain-containing protein [Pseudomonadota bacterium]|nr:ATP-binding cassette domain-containing protein [Pseudomonadota bacterium]